MQAPPNLDPLNLGKDVWQLIAQDILRVSDLKTLLLFCAASKARDCVLCMVQRTAPDWRKQRLTSCFGRMCCKSPSLNTRHCMLQLKRR